MEERALVGEVRAISEVTFYSLHGDVFAWSVFVVTVLGLAVATFLRPRALE
jgi:apolipoprotein N-acyltransferase